MQVQILEESQHTRKDESRFLEACRELQPSLPERLHVGVFISELRPETRWHMSNQNPGVSLPLNSESVGHPPMSRYLTLFYAIRNRPFSTTQLAHIMSNRFVHAITNRVATDKLLPCTISNSVKSPNTRPDTITNSVISRKSMNFTDFSPPVWAQAITYPVLG